MEELEEIAVYSILFEPVVHGTYEVFGVNVCWYNGLMLQRPFLAHDGTYNISRMIQACMSNIHYASVA